MKSAVRLFPLKPCRRSDNSQPFLSLLGVSFIAHSSSWDWLAQIKNSDQHLGPGPAAWLKPEQREGGTGTYMYVCFLLYVGASFEPWRLHPCTKAAQLAQVQPASCHTECFVIVQEEGEPIRSGQAEDEKCHKYGFQRPPFIMCGDKYLRFNYDSESREMSFVMFSPRRLIAVIRKSAWLPNKVWQQVKFQDLTFRTAPLNSCHHTPPLPKL